MSINIKIVEHQYIVNMQKMDVNILQNRCQVIKGI